MAEYFDISLIVKKTATSSQKMKKCLAEKFGLHEGENTIEYFPDQEILLSSFEDENRDFDEISLGFPEQTFHRNRFKKELEIFTSFINTCFECNYELQYAVCSYELNGYLLGRVERLKDFNDELLSKFPIVFKREIENDQPKLLLNLEAQEILT